MVNDMQWDVCCGTTGKVYLKENEKHKKWYYSTRPKDSCLMVLRKNSSRNFVVISAHA